MDPASAILTALALAFVVAALSCGWRALRVAGVRVRLAWAGRMLALLGAAFAIWFPAELYGEVDVVVRNGSDDLAWLPFAIWYQAALMPLTVIPALVSLRSTFAAGLLFLVALALQVALDVLRPFGVVFPDASPDLIFSYGPNILTAALLLAGRAGPELGRRLSGDYLTLGPAR